MQVPFASIVLMVINIIIGILIPIVISLYLNRKYHVKYSTFFIGFFTFLIFAYVLERLMHSLVLTSFLGNVIVSNIFFYALYGGFAAALFEESGRFVAYKFLIKDIDEKDDSTALMYGAGHAGIEILLILVASMISNIMISLSINNGTINDILAGMDEASMSQYVQAITALCATPSWYFILSLVERIFAFIAQLTMSLLVFRAIKEKNYLYLLISFLFHLLLDAISVIAQYFIANLVVVELIVALSVIIMVYVSTKLIPLKLNKNNN